MKYFVVDVFTDKVFGGNPAGVCLLDAWLADDVLQNIAAENNLSETAFVVKSGGYYDLRWFTPFLEVDLCGHATMGSAYVLYNNVGVKEAKIEFHTKSGVLTVEKKGDTQWMDLPARPGTPASRYESVRAAFSVNEFEMYKSADLLVVVDSAETVKNLEPDFDALSRVKAEAGMPGDDFGVIVTAPGADCDFVSRFFAPNAGIAEDPVTGRAHCVLIPYWSKRLNKKSMTARQLSKRGGRLLCEDAGDRVKIGGKAVLYMSGEINI